MAEFRIFSGTDAPAVPPSWASSPQAQSAFLKKLGEASTPLLICDYDGTLAPFKEDKMQAVAYPGVSERLAAITEGRTRVAFVSGRPVQELIQLLPLAAQTEIWGMHGREHREPDGTVHRIEPSAPQRTALDAAEARLQEAGLGSLTERKTASLALHWRTLEAHPDNAERLREVQAFGRDAFTAYAGRDALALLPFDGGVELRAEDHTKGHATAALLDSGNSGATAFLGDDTTDEDAFQVIRARGGLGLLVREPPRSSYAHFALRPPGELLAFLDLWLSTVEPAGQPANRFVH